MVMISRTGEVLEVDVSNSPSSESNNLQQFGVESLRGIADLFVGSQVPGTPGKTEKGSISFSGPPNNPDSATFPNSENSGQIPNVEQVNQRDIESFINAGSQAWPFIQEGLGRFSSLQLSLVESLTLYPNIDAVPNHQPTTAPAFVSFTEPAESTRISLVVDELNILAGSDPEAANVYRVNLLTHEYCHVLQRLALGSELRVLNEALDSRTWNNIDLIRKILVEGGAEYTATQILPENLRRENPQYNVEGLAEKVNEIVNALPGGSETFFRAMYAGDQASLDQVIAAAAVIDDRLPPASRVTPEYSIPFKK